MSGRLTKDWELKFTPQGTAVATNTIAINRMKKDEADFIPVVVWNKAAEFISEKTVKGNRVELTGRIQVRNYDNKEGKKIYITEVIAEEINPIDWASSVPSNVTNSDYEKMEEITDGDIPFN
jgi:single-strand DNA-binding protein